MNEQERTLLADIAANAFHWSEYKNFSEEVLLAAFDDESEKVQEQATDVFRESKDTDFSNCLALAEKFIQTPAFIEKPDVMDIVIPASKTLLESIVERQDQHGGRGTGLYKLHDLIAREYVSSEKRPQARKKILDLIDYMAENEIYGTDKIIELNDR